MLKWISVKKHLPRIGQRVFTCDIELEYDPKDKNDYPKNYIFITQFNLISEDEFWNWGSAEKSKYVYSKNGQKCAFFTTPEETLTTSHWAVINFVVPIKAKKKQNNKLDRFEMMDL